MFKLKRAAPDGGSLWAFRYRAGGRGTARTQHGAYSTEDAARAALELELERVARAQHRPTRQLMLTELVVEYLAENAVSAVTTEKLRWLLAKTVTVFGERRLHELRLDATAAWRMTIPYGHRFDAT